MPITIVNDVVPPTAIVLLATAFVTDGVTCTVAVPGAVAVLETNRLAGVGGHDVVGHRRLRL